jgi:hypothetical protein
LCSSLLLRPENPCCNAFFPILLLDIFMNMLTSQNRSNCAFRHGFLRLGADSTAQSGFKEIPLVSQGKTNHNICCITRDWSSDFLALRKMGEKPAYDQRILAEVDFVEEIQTNLDNLVMKNLRLSGQRIDISQLAEKVCQKRKVSINELCSGNRCK